MFMKVWTNQSPHKMLGIALFLKMLSTELPSDQQFQFQVCREEGPTNPWNYLLEGRPLIVQASLSR